MELFIVWIGLSLLVGVVGKDRNIGFGWSFFWSLILSPLIGVVIALISDKKNVPGASNSSGGVSNWQREYDEAKKAEYKGQIDIAIDSYMNTLYYLENFKEKISKNSDEYRLELIIKIKNKVKVLRQNNSKEQFENRIKGDFDIEPFKR